MSRYGVHRRVLLTCVFAVAACTDPTFAELSSEGGSVAPSETDDADARAEDDDDVDASRIATLDSAQPSEDSSVATRDDGGDVGATRASVEAGTSLDSATPPAVDAQQPDVQVPNVPPLDAQVLDAAGGDPQPDAAPPDPVPSWAKPLLGRFAKRSVFFAYDVTGPIVTVTIDVSLINITASANGQLELTGQPCAFRVYWSDGGASYTLVKPQAVPPFHMWLSLGQAPHFSSDTASFYMGYDPTRQSRCSGSASADRFEDQSWLTTGRCACTSAPEVLPTEANDCRVTDPERDGRPGVTLDGAGFAFDISAALNNTLKFADGEVRVDGEHVLREQRTRNVACLGSCFSMNEELCPGGETQMRPLSANATCTEALAKVDPLAFPPIPTKDCRAK